MPLKTSPSGMVWCDVASNGAHERQYIGTLFPRVDVAPGGAWVAVDGRFDDTCFVDTSAGAHLELGRRHGNNPACVRFQSDGFFHVYMVASVDVDGGRHWLFDALGTFLEERPHFSALAAGSQGITDVTIDGEILFWDQNNWLILDGVNLRNWRRRGDFVVGVIQEDPDNRVVVYDEFNRSWYRVGPWNVQVLAGIAASGTVSVQADQGGFVPSSDWLTRPFDPHEVTEPDEPPVIVQQPKSVTVNQGDTAMFAVVANGTAPLHYEWLADDQHVGHDQPNYQTGPLEDTTEVWVVVSNDAGSVTSSHARATVRPDPIDPTYPTEPEEPDMTRNLVKVDNAWHEVEEVPHPDAGPDHGPVVGVVRVRDGLILKVRNDGRVEFEAGSPGADERLIPVPGGYVALRDTNAVIDKAGPWSK